MPSIPTIARNIEEASTLLQYHRVITTAQFRAQQKEVNTPKELKPAEEKRAIEARSLKEAQKSDEAKDSVKKPERPERLVNLEKSTIGRNIDIIF